MRQIFLQGFAFNSTVWRGHFAPNLNFESIEKAAVELSESLEVGEKTALIGWSMGGMVAMRAAVLAPEKISSLILVSTTPKFIKSAEYPYAVPFSLLERLKKRIKIEGISAFHSLVLKDDRQVGQAQLSWERAERELVELERVDLRCLLPDIRMPTLILHGTQDQICLPGAAKYMKEMIPKSELIMLDGIGHAPMIEAPQIFNQHLRKFIKNHAG